MKQIFGLGAELLLIKKKNNLNRAGESASILFLGEL